MDRILGQLVKALPLIYHFSDRKQFGLQLPDSFLPRLGRSQKTAPHPDRQPRIHPWAESQISNLKSADADAD